MKELEMATRHVLYEAPFVKVVSLSWSQDDQGPDLGESLSEMLVFVQSGAFEKNVHLGIKHEVSRVLPGQMFRPIKGVSHKLRCVSNDGVTIHVCFPAVSNALKHERFDFSEGSAPDVSLANPVNLETLESIFETFRGHTVTTDSPYFMNQLFSGVLPQMLMAESLLSESKTTLATFEMSPLYSRLETEIIEELGALIGWDEGSRDGVFVPGGSAANFMALHCARHQRFPQAKENGLHGAKCLVFVSSEAHYSFKKAAMVLGLGLNSLVVVPSNSKGQMCVEALERLLNEHQKRDEVPLLVCATAGTTVFGAFDPIDQIAVVCKKYNTWLHVDAAWGGPVLFSERHRKVVQGIEAADSVTFDAHKLCGANLTCALFLTRHHGLLLDANDVSGGDYLFHAQGSDQDRGKSSWQCGRKADVLSFWGIWKSVGTGGLGKFVDSLIELRERTVAWIKEQPRIQLIHQPEYLNVCFRIEPRDPTITRGEWTYMVRTKLKSDNVAMINYSFDTEGCFLRMILAHPRLQFEHITTILDHALEVT